MKLASYTVDGKPAYGVVTDEGVITVSCRLSGAPALRDAIANDRLAEMRRFAGGTPDHQLADLSFLPVIPNPDKVLCVGVNYKAHAAEVGRALPPQPTLFARLLNTLVGDGGEMIRPRISECFDFEGELAIVIGKPGRYLKPEQALEHVCGYTIFIDGSVRDYQKHSVTAGKNFPATGPLGPWIVTTDEIPDPAQLTLTTRLNGQQVQHSGTDQMIYSIPKIISSVSEFTPLLPGDIIATGTPEGVGHGRTPPLWMKSGDVLEVEITRIGTLRTKIVDEPK